MANIHQTLKRVASLYEDLIGTREEAAGSDRSARP